MIVTSVQYSQIVELQKPSKNHSNKMIIRGSWGNRLLKSKML